MSDGAIYERGNGSLFPCSRASSALVTHVHPRRIRAENRLEFWAAGFEASEFGFRGVSGLGLRVQTLGLGHGG